LYQKKRHAIMADKNEEDVVGEEEEEEEEEEAGETHSKHPHA